MKSIEVSVTVGSNQYRATVHENGSVTICSEMDGGGSEWLGTGRWSKSQIVDCPANLGDDVYAAMEDSIASALAESAVTIYTHEDIDLEHRLSELANEEGTIQAADMLTVAPHHRPELHTTMSVARAFSALTGKSYDTDRFCS